MRKDRIKDIISRLKEVKSESFDMRYFFSGGVGIELAETTSPTCNSKACVIGWCCRWYPEDWTLRQGLGPVHAGHVDSFQGMAKFLDIPVTDAMYLFCAARRHTHNTPKEMVRLLQCYLDCDGLLAEAERV